MIRVRIWKGQEAGSCFTCVEVACDQGVKLGQRVFNIKDFLIKWECLGLYIECELGQRDKIGSGCEVFY